MKICIHYSGRKRCTEIGGPPSIALLERLAADFFGLHNTRFILYYLDEDDQNVVLIEPEDLQVCAGDFPNKNFELNVVSAESGLFQLKNTEIVKRMFLKELKERAREGGETFSLQEHLALIQTYLAQFIRDEHVLSNIIEHLRSSYEMQQIEAELSMLSDCQGTPTPSESDQPAEKSKGDHLSVSSIPDKETSAKSFFTDASNDELRKFGLGKGRITYVNQLSEIPEDNASMLSNCSDDSDMKMPEGRIEPAKTVPLENWPQDLRKISPEPCERLSDGEKLKDYYRTNQPIFASEITRRPEKDKDKSLTRRFLTRIKRLYQNVKSGLNND